MKNWNSLYLLYIFRIEFSERPQGGFQYSSKFAYMNIRFYEYKRFPGNVVEFCGIRSAEPGVIVANVNIMEKLMLTMHEETSNCGDRRINVCVHKTSRCRGAVVASFFASKLVDAQERAIRYMQAITDSMKELIPETPTLKQVYIKEFIELYKVVD